jgi:DNA repair protein RadC
MLKLGGQTMLNDYIPMVKLSYVSDFKQKISEREKVKQSGDAARLFRQLFDLDIIEHHELFFIMMLNRAGRLLGFKKISEGGCAGTVVDPKIIFQAAILCNAQTIVLCHNHPSGNLEPSPQDKAITKKVVEAGKLLDIYVSDHIIITSESYFSFADEWLM